MEFRYAEPMTAKRLLRLSEKIGKTYDATTAEEEVKFQLNLGSGSADVIERMPVAKHTSRDQTELFIAKPCTLTWSRLAPYEGWDSFIARIAREYKIAATLGANRPLERIGLRFINRIDVPLDPDSGVFRYEDFIAVTVGLPDLFDPVASYQWRIDKVFSESKLMAVIQSATLMSEVPGTMGFLIDIDVGANEGLPSKHDDIFNRLSDMRALKNELFEVMITEHARESFR